MLDILVKAGAFVLAVVLGYIFKLKGLVGASEGRALSKIVMNLTLPAALLISAKDLKISLFLLIPVSLALLGNFLMLALGFYRGHKKSAVQKAQETVQLAGYNVGNFAFPFVQSFFPASYLIYVILFDTGNALMVFGGNYVVANAASQLGHRMRPRDVLKKLLSSVPFCTYLICFSLSLLKLKIPLPLLSIAKIAADANPFLAMFVLGNMVDFQLSRAAFKELSELLTIRVLGNGLLIVLVYLLPIDLTIKEMLSICLMAPIAVLTPIFARELGSHSPTPANINSLTILISVFMITAYILLI
ncbi:AEC family transporter [Streptococcus catagoni]|uniref:AEC family transporter n=1 Tax=Streptococcus catagoni TaxID=2654874 RepID=UPI00140AB6A4|nr:permease [Streptococcus catagoni]